MEKSKKSIIDLLAKDISNEYRSVNDKSKPISDYFPINIASNEKEKFGYDDESMQWNREVDVNSKENTLNDALLKLKKHEESNPDDINSILIDIGDKGYGPAKKTIEMAKALDVLVKKREEDNRVKKLLSGEAPVSSIQDLLTIYKNK